MAQNNDVDINVLISIYNQKLSTISNQNVLLEAKIQTITQDFLEEKTELLRQLKEMLSVGKIMKKYLLILGNQFSRGMKYL